MELSGRDLVALEAGLCSKESPHVRDECATGGGTSNCFRGMAEYRRSARNCRAPNVHKCTDPTAVRLLGNDCRFPTEPV
jgi:hypothetical protein